MRTATVTAKTPLRLFVMTRQDFRRLLAREAFEQRARFSACTFVAWLKSRARLAYSGPLAESSR